LQELQLLNASFEELPKHLFSDSNIKFRFCKGNNKRILIMVDKPDQYSETGLCSWYIWADSEENLLELVKSVWPCGTLATDLESNSEYGKRVLETLRGN
jgi:hypothetical protein